MGDKNIVVPKSLQSIDVTVGKNVRAIRKMRSQTQSDLAKALNITFQQVQKYETGKNRISASTLFLISKHLSVDVSHFFDGVIAPKSASHKGDDILKQLSHSKAIELVKSISSIENEEVLEKMLSLVKL